jgi:hypothetical protein
VAYRAVGPIPTAIFHDDGSMRKCCKSDLIHLLEKEISTSFILPSYDKNKSTLSNNKRLQIFLSLINTVLERIFYLFFCMQTCRDVNKVFRACFNVEKVLAYRAVGPIPTAIFHDDGSMRKCCKSDLIHLLEKEISTSFILPADLFTHVCKS